MIYGYLKGLEKPISRLVLGTMVCTTEDTERTNTLLDAWVAAGGNCLDTAHVYGGGKSERAIGQWMQSRGNREHLVIIDKGAHPYWQEPRVNPECIAQDIAENLERLQTDYIDLYLLHRDDPQVPVGPIVECLNQHCAAGHIRLFGGSNWSTERLQAANDYAAAHGLQGFSASSPQLSLAVAKEPMWGGCLSLDTAGRQWHTATQLPLFPWSSQASGFFTGRFSPDNLDNADIVRVYYSDTNWERLRRAQALGMQKGVSANNIALAWVLQQPFPVFPLIGPRTPTELEESLGVLNVLLSDAEWEGLEAFE